jgi:NAD(P)-dependent dehydrogenase (short-subunit alcohol dehydrogenase family)
MSSAPALAGQTVVVIGGSSGIGFETARQARSEGANVVLTGRDPQRLEHAARELGALGSSAAFDATDFERLGRFFDELPTPIDHVMVTAGAPYYARLADIDFTQARRNIDQELWLPLHVARRTVGKVRPGGTLLLIGGTGGRRPDAGPLVVAFTAATAALTRALALELAPVRVNLIAPGFVDTPLSASILGAQLDARREQLRTTLPIRRVVGPADIAMLAIHLMTNTAVTGATYDIDGGQQLVEG